MPYFQMLPPARLAEVLDPAHLPLPERPRIAAIEVDEKIDSIGDEALEVWVILDDSEDEEWSGFTFDDVRAAFEVVRQALRDAGEDRFVYPSLNTRRQYERRYTPEDDDEAAE